MYGQTLKIIAYFIVSLVIGIAVTLLADKIEDATIEKHIRNALEENIKHALSSFKESASNISASDEKVFMRKFIDMVMNDKVEVFAHGASIPQDGRERRFLFTLRDDHLDLDVYVKAAYLKSELANLDVVDYVSGITATIIVFSSLVFYMENRRRILSMQQQFELKHAELNSALKQHEALTLLGRMSAALAHELKTPIATISNLVQTFPARQTDPQFVNRFLALMHEELNRTQQLIDNLLAYGKEIDIRTNEWMAIEPLLGKNRPNGLTIEMPASIMMLGDRFFAELLFKNLIRNSLEAGADRISVRGLDPDPAKQAYAAIVLEDNGAGFPPVADLEKLADPFVTSRSRGGGLGLYLARKIAAAHEGSLSLERMEKGARVVILLPRNRIKISDHA